MCNFVASSHAFVVKAGLDCDHWCPYIVRRRVPLCVLLTRVWKQGLMQAILLSFVFWHEETTLTRTFFIHFLGNFHPCGSAFNNLKPGFHTCVSRTHNSARCLKMYGHQWSQAITAFATKACDLAKKSHMLNFCEGLCCDMLWLWSIETNNARKKKIFSPPKKSKAKKQKKGRRLSESRDL